VFPVIWITTLLITVTLPTLCYLQILG
jgi:hypothetical protein